MKKYFSILLLVFIAVFFKSCATPMGPTGGERDTEGPNVVETDPANRTTNFDGNRVSFKFDQFIDRNSFRQNVSVEPDLGIEFEIGFGRKTATIEFQSPLPDNTTLIVKVGTDVTDTDRNKMDASFDLALSTGDVLDNATVTARIINAETGEGETGNRVFLYAEPFDITQRSRYVAETDTAGRIHFGYLSEGTYKAFWVNDMNRNRIWERLRESAQPFYTEAFELSRDDSLDIGTIYISTPDTVAPSLDGVGLLTEERVRLRLSEKAVWNESSEFIVTDTLGNEFTRAIPLYPSEQDDAVLFAQTLEELPESQDFMLDVKGVADEAGNPLKINISSFSGSAQDDTTSLQTVSHNAGSGLFPDEALEITYSKLIDDDSVVDSLIVLEGDRVIENWQPLEVDNHILRISPPDTWESGIRYQFRVWNPWSLEREQIEPDIWQRNQLGGIELSVENGDTTRTSYLRLTDTEGSIRVDTTFTTSIVVDNLPPLQYKAIIFEDVNDNGRWDSGRIIPFSRPEPYGVRTNIPVREGFTSEVSISYSPASEATEPEEIPEFNNNPNR